MATSASTAASFDSGQLQGVLDGRYRDLREKIRGVLSRREFGPVGSIPTEEYRRRVLEWAQTLAGEGLTAPGFPREFGGEGDPGANVRRIRDAGARGPVAAGQVRSPVRALGRRHQQLGTGRHHKRYLEPTAKLELPGCFCDDLGRTWIRCPAASDDRDLREGIRRVRDRLPERGRAQGIHRATPPPTAGSPPCSRN